MFLVDNSTKYKYVFRRQLHYIEGLDFRPTTFCITSNSSLKEFKFKKLVTWHTLCPVVMSFYVYNLYVKITAK